MMRAADIVEEAMEWNSLYPKRTGPAALTEGPASEQTARGVTASRNGVKPKPNQSIPYQAEKWCRVPE